MPLSLRPAHLLIPLALALVVGLAAASGCGDECTGICGCFDDVTLTISTRVTDPAGASLEGVQLFCDEEVELVATSSADGAITSSFVVGQSERCGYERCGRLRFEDPSGAHRARLIAFEDVAPSGTVVLELSIEPVTDGGITDGGITDGGMEDGGLEDGGVEDGGTLDAAVSDAGDTLDAS